MKTIIMVLISLLSLHCISSYSFAKEVFVDFEDAELTQSIFGGMNQDITYNMKPHEGRGGSGATSSGIYTYKGKSLNFSEVNTSIIVSCFFHLAVSDPPSYQTGRLYGEIYLMPSSNRIGERKRAFAEFGISYPSGGVLSDKISGGSLATVGSFPGFGKNYPVGTFKPGSWYELKVTFTNLGGMIRYEIIITEFDAEGLNSVQTVAELTETTTDSVGLTKDKEVYAGFSFGSPGGAKVADDFSIIIND